MSGLRPDAMRQFYTRLHDRGENTDTLARAVGRSRPTVTRLLNGSRRRGPAWAALAKHLTPEELALLDVAQCHPWNKKRIDRRPKWNPAKLTKQPEPTAPKPRGLSGLNWLMSLVRREASA